MSSKGKKFLGPVEVDEVYMGGRERNKHESKKLKAGRGIAGKVPVVGMKDRDTGKVRAKVVVSTDKPTLQKHYSDIVAAGAEVLAISTDNLSGSESMIRQARLEFPLLYTSKDPSVPQSYDVFNLHGDGLASASVFIVDVDGNIAYSDIGRSTSHQVSGKTVLAELEKLGS